jgi:hypothetical protein
MNRQTINNIVYALIAVLLIVLVTMLVMFLVNRGGEKEFKDDLSELRNDMSMLKNVKDSDIDDVYTLNKELVQAVYRNRNTREIFQNLLKNIEKDECKNGVHSDLSERLKNDTNLDHILHDVFDGVKGCKDISGTKSEVRISMMLLLVVLMRMGIINIYNAYEYYKKVFPDGPPPSGYDPKDRPHKRQLEPIKPRP